MQLEQLVVRWRFVRLPVQIPRELYLFFFGILPSCQRMRRLQSTCAVPQQVLESIVNFSVALQFDYGPCRQSTSTITERLEPDPDTIIGFTWTSRSSRTASSIAQKARTWCYHRERHDKTTSHRVWAVAYTKCRRHASLRAKADVWRERGGGAVARHTFFSFFFL